MEWMLKEFLGLLEGETDLYRSLLDSLQKEKQAVVDSDLKQLNEITKEKENLILKIRILEEQRRRIHNKLAAELGVDAESLTLTRLSERVESPFSEQLKASGSNLLALTQSIQEINASNKFFLRHALELVRGSLSLLNNLIASNAVYYRSGQMQLNQQSGKVFSSKI